MTAKISQLTGKPTLGGAEQVEINDAGTSKRATVQAIADLAAGGGVNIPGLPAASALDGTELHHVSQGGTDKKATGTQITTKATTDTMTAMPASVAAMTAASALDGSELFLAVQGGANRKATGTQITTKATSDAKAAMPDAIKFMIDGGGAAITAGMKGYIEVPYACTINRATLLADQSGSIVVDVFRSTYAAFDPTTHPASSDKITASAPPTISSAKKSQDATLTGWTTTLAAGDILAFNVNSITTIQRVTISLKVTRT